MGDVGEGGVEGRLKGKGERKVKDKIKGRKKSRSRMGDYRERRGVGRDEGIGCECGSCGDGSGSKGRDLS